MATAQNFEYAYPSDDLSRSILATLSSGVQSSGYDPSRLQNDDPSYPFKVDSTTFRLVWDFGSATTVKYVLLVHHNFQAGLTGVSFQMNATNAWGAPSFTQDFTIRTYQEDSFPVNEHLDLRPTNPSYRYASLVVSNANVVNCAVGKCAILTTVRSLTRNLLVGGQDEESHPLVEHATDLGVSTIYSLGTRRRWLRSNKIATEADALLIRSMIRASSGRAVPFVIIPHLEDAAAGTIEESMIVRWEKPSVQRMYTGPGLMSQYAFAFEEVSRGLKPTPSAV